MLQFSVIIPVYNVEAYLPACLESVLNQTGNATYEVILVDDGSPDGSGGICDCYAARYDQIRVIHTENHGVSHARNVGLAAAGGQYVLFLDADDLWEDGLLTALTELIGTAPDMVAFGNVRLTEEGQIMPGITDPVIPAGESGTDFLERMFAAGRVPRAYSWAYAIRREFLENHGIRFREDMKVSEDFDLLMRCFGKAESITGTDKQLYGYRCRSTSASMNLTPKKLMDNLTSKAAYFRLHPTAPMANTYGNNALLVANMSKDAAKEALVYLAENRDIWKSVSEPPLKLGHILIRIFGDYGGARIYGVIRTNVRRLKHAGSKG